MTFSVHDFRQHREWVLAQIRLEIERVLGETNTGVFQVELLKGPKK